MDKKLKLILISQYVPYESNSGITVKIHELLKCLTEVSDVACIYLTEDRGAGRKALQSCKLDIKNHLICLPRFRNRLKRYFFHLLGILYVSAKTRRKLSELIETEKPDVIWLEFGYICHLVPFLRKFNVPIIYGSHNSQFKLEFDIWKTGLNLFQKIGKAPLSLLHFIHERFFFRMPDKILCTSQNDLAYYKRFLPINRLDILSYYLDDSHIRLKNPIAAPDLLVSIIGGMRSYQNYSAVIFTLQKIWPSVVACQNDATLFIIGRLPENDSPEYKMLAQLVEQSKNVALIGEVEDVIPYVKASAVSIAPILVGSGVRTKIIESVASKTPVVSTSAGAEGLPFTSGAEILIADDPVDFARKMLLLLGDSTLRSKQARNAYIKYSDMLSHRSGVQRVRHLLNTLKCSCKVS